MGGHAGQQDQPVQLRLHAEVLFSNFAQLWQGLFKDLISM